MSDDARKPRVLVVECYCHPKVLENVNQLLMDRCSVTFYMNPDVDDLNTHDRRSNDLLFPSARRARVITNRFHGSTLFVWLPFFGWRYDYINISTGPEGSHWCEIVNILFFLLTCRLYRNRVILTVKSTRPYLATTPGVYAFVRSRCTRLVRRLTFETETLRDMFREHVPAGTYRTGVSYDRYTDLLPARYHDPAPARTGGRVRIGLLGTVDADRRDYDTLMAALDRLSPEARATLEMVTLGGCAGGANHPIIRRMAERVAVDCQDGLLSADEFDARGVGCDLLISPLRDTWEYGAFKGSGAFGDAVYLRKRLVLPAGADPRREFREIARYYNGAEELSRLLSGARELADVPVDPAFTARFSREAVFRRLVADLDLCQGKTVAGKS